MKVVCSYNSLARREVQEPFPIVGRILTLYSGGSTVYDDAHIGNFRSFLNADLLRRTLELRGHRVKHVMTFTEVGHMTEYFSADGCGGDKLAVAVRPLAEAKKCGKLPSGAVDPASPIVIADFMPCDFSGRTPPPTERRH